MSIRAKEMKTTKTFRETVLVVDDTPDNIVLLTGILDPHYRIKVAINGRIALKIAATEATPDLILLDVMMPDMDGYEVCRRLKADPKTRDIPVIFVTAKTESEDEVHGLELGAVDFVSKPIRALAVLARVRTHLALKQARAELADLNVILQHEKDVVESIVARMHATDDFDKRNVRSHFTSVDRTAGDMIFSAYRPDGAQHVMLGDFSGHGLPAAVAGPLVSYIFYSLTGLGKPMEAILTELNRTLNRQLPSQIYMAASAIEITPDRQRANIWNHGLPRTLIIANGAVRERIESTDMPLGVIDPLDITPSAAAVAVTADDFFYIFSDGMNEIPSPSDEQFGIPRLEELLAAISLSGQALESIWATLTAHHGNANFPDDATLIEVSMRPLPDGADKR